MKFSIKNIAHTFAIAFLILLAGCKEQYDDLSIQKELVTDLDNVSKKGITFLNLVEKSTDQKKIQNAFNTTRLEYKKVEWAIEYFIPNAARFINGPALDELEVAENTAFPPNGFQVIEELIYPNYSIKNKPDLIREIKILEGNLKQVKQHLLAITIEDSHVIDALKMQVIRIMSLGITGFDSPIALKSIAEAKSSLLSLKKTILMLDYDNPSSKNLKKELEKIIIKAGKFCDENADFDSFDRAIFIKEYLNPIYSKLVLFQNSSKIKNTNKINAINPEALTIFDKNSFNVDAFIPSKEFKFSKEKARLGEKLFFETKFSDNNTRNCSSCHNPEKAFTDGYQTNLSLAGGFLKRNTPTLTYASFQNALFWDLRQLDLEKQSMDVIENKDEMHGKVSNAIALIKKDTAYLNIYKKAFPNSKNIEVWQIQNALASYIRSLNAFDSKFDLYMRGTSNQLTAQEKLGFNLFAGKAKCATCHFIPLFNGTVPPGYQKTEQEVIGVPADKNGKKISPDLGRYVQYQMPQLKNSFKTPTLRNVAVTAPYMHNGVYTTLEEIVDFYNQGGGIGLGLSIANQTLPQDKLKLSDNEVKALVTFMKTLTDNNYLKK